MEYYGLYYKDSSIFILINSGSGKIEWILDVGLLTNEIEDGDLSIDVFENQVYMSFMGGKNNIYANMDELGTSVFKSVLSSEREAIADEISSSETSYEDSIGEVRSLVENQNKTILLNPREIRRLTLVKETWPNGTIECSIILNKPKSKAISKSKKRRTKSRRSRRRRISRRKRRSRRKRL